MEGQVPGELDVDVACMGAAGADTNPSRGVSTVRRERRGDGAFGVGAVEDVRFSRLRTLKMIDCQWNKFTLYIYDKTC